MAFEEEEVSTRLTGRGLDYLREELRRSREPVVRSRIIESVIHQLDEFGGLTPDQVAKWELEVGFKLKFMPGELGMRSPIERRMIE